MSRALRFLVYGVNWRNVWTAFFCLFCLAASVWFLTLFASGFFD